MGISIVMPARRRNTTPQAISSVVEAGIGEGDQFIVMFDGGRLPEWWGESVVPLLDLMESRGVEVRARATGGPFGDVGGTARNMGQEFVNNENWVMYLDDDDGYVKGALDIVRRWIRAVPNRNHMFQMRYKDGRVLWMHKRIYEGNVGTPMMVLQPGLHHAGHWDGRRCQDYRYCLMVTRAWANVQQRNETDAFFWHDHVICEVRPWGN